jgi:hypothetical protein
MTAEVRARTLTGRDQISDAGQHLIDGIPFGRPYLRQPNRPAVRIPPRKRRRQDEGEAEDETEAVGLITANGEDISDEDAPALVNGLYTRSGNKRRKSGQASKLVQFKQPEIDASDDSEEDDEDFAPGGAEEDKASSEESSGGDSDSDSDTDADAESGASSSASGTSDASSDSDSDSSSGSDSDDSDASSPPDVLSSKDGRKKKDTPAHPPDDVPPGRGRQATKERNARRTTSNRLRHLQKAGKVPENATFSDLREYERGQRDTPEEESLPAQPFSYFEGKKTRLEEDKSEEVAEESMEDAEESAEVVASEPTELELRKQKLMARLGDAEESTGVVASEPTERDLRKQELMARLGHTSYTPAPASQSVDPESLIAKPAKASPQPPPKEEKPARKRLRPDTAAIGRILARQANPVARKTKTKPVTPEPEGASDPEFWKSRISLSAFECWEEDFELTTPPFPFQQHWDPASQLMREKAGRKRNQKKRKYESQNAFPAEEAEEEEEKIILNYDDVPATQADSEINAAIEDQLRQDVATAAEAHLPSLPEDMSTLPDLTPSDMKAGAVIACKFFTVNPITVTPEISTYKTATVEQEGDSGPGAGTITLKIAARDLERREKKFDSKGNRVYNAADALLMAEEEGEEGIWEGSFAELLEPKLLKAA